MKAFFLSMTWGLSLFFTGSALASGSHGSHIWIKNNTNQSVSSGVSLKVFVFNGDDGSCTFEDKTYRIKPGKKKKIKCHGNGTNSCKVAIQGLAAGYNKGYFQMDDKNVSKCSKRIKNNTLVKCVYPKQCYTS